MRLYLVLLLIICSGHGLAQHQVTSPDQSIQVSVTGGTSLFISALQRGDAIINASEIGMIVRGIKTDSRIRKATRIQHDGIIHPPVAEKRKTIRDHFNEMILSFRSGMSLQVRVYDDGFAYRFLSNIRDSIIIEREIARYSIDPSTTFYGPAVTPRDGVDIFHTSFEEPYLIKPPDSISSNLLFFSPVMVAFRNGAKLVITESDLEDYPGMFLRFNDSKVLEGVNAPYPTAVRMNPGQFPQEVVTQRADFIARTRGKRTFPWRVFMLSETDKELPGNDMVYRLASPPRVTDTQWIKPGKGTDEWIIGINLFNVSFKAGVNTATYKYYIDFAKRFGLERIMMDAGWSETTDLFSINPDVNMDEIAAYAKASGISLSMWTLASTLDRQLEPALDQFKKWGVDFIMTDFMDRDDQKMVNFYHRIAEACARKKIMVMFHGAFKPTGFSRTWPNAVTREGVLGSEYNIWSEKATPDHDLLLPFIRMTAGPMDYEPGILDNATKSTFRPIAEKVMSMGTRMHQAAMFIVYESPIQLFSGNPSQGLLEPEFMKMIGSIPTVWDETMVLEGSVGKNIVVARRKDNNWYIGGMSNWDGKDLVLPLSFLDEGNYQAVIALDGVNADRYAADYTISEENVNKETRLPITMANGGGFVLILKKNSEAPVRQTN